MCRGRQLCWTPSRPISTRMEETASDIASKLESWACFFGVIWSLFQVVRLFFRWRKKQPKAIRGKSLSESGVLIQTFRGVIDIINSPILGDSENKKSPTRLADFLREMRRGIDGRSNSRSTKPVQSGLSNEFTRICRRWNRMGVTGDVGIPFSPPLPLKNQTDTVDR